MAGISTTGFSPIPSTFALFLLIIVIIVVSIPNGRYLLTLTDLLADFIDGSGAATHIDRADERPRQCTDRSRQTTIEDRKDLIN